MKSILQYAIGLAAFFFSAAPATGQHHMLGEDVGAYAGAVVKLSNVNKASGFLMGARIGMTTAAAREASLKAGVAMYGLMNGVHINARDDVRLVYGGVDLEYVWRPANLLHFSAMTLIGAGAADTDAADRSRYSHMWLGGPALLVIEPGIGVALNLGPMLLLGGGATYRAVAGSTDFSLRYADLSGWTGQLTLTIGRH